MMTKPDRRQQISQILMRWQMPTRQVAINEIMAAVEQFVDGVIGEYKQQDMEEYQSTITNVERGCRNRLRAEQRKRTGINVQTNQRKERNDDL